MLEAKPRLTVVLLCYRRPHNTDRIISALTGQSHKPTIFLWNNSGVPLNDPRIDWELASSDNRMCWPRWFMAANAKTEFFASMDDDITPLHSGVIEILVSELQKLTFDHQLLGVEGVRLAVGKPYFPTYEGRVRRSTAPEHSNTSIHFWNVVRDEPVDIVKGRMLAGRTSAMKQIPMQCPLADECDDIAISAMFAKGAKKAHLIPAAFRGCFDDMPEMNDWMALSRNPRWPEIREKARQHFFAD